MLDDSSVRVVDVYVPAGHDGQGLPLLVDLVGFTSSGLSHTNWVGFRENLPERLDRLIGEQHMPPVVVAFPDCFTRLGGNQYINSASMGAWEDFLLHEMLPAIEQHFECAFIVKGGSNVYGSSPDIDELFPLQADELDPKKRAAILEKMQRLVHEKAINAPIWELAFLNGVGPRVGESSLGKIAGFPYTAPFEDITIKGS